MLGVMRITKFGHACVRLEHEGTQVAIDPGLWTQPEAVDGVDAVFITHEHPDHVHVDHLRRTDAPVHTIRAVAEKIRAEAPDVAERVSVVRPGDRLDPGIPVTVVGELHAVIHPELPRFDNSGYLFSAGGTTLFHPGDALTVPEEAVDVLCVPVSAPWLKASEAIDFARAVKAPRNLAIHDRVYSEAGLGIIDGQMDAFLPGEGLSYHRIADGQEL